MAYGKPISSLPIEDITACYDEMFADLGSIYIDDDGKAYRAVKFGEALAAGDVVGFSDSNRTTVTKAGTYGFAGVVLGTTEADTYGLVQCGGVASASVAAGTAAGNALVSDGAGVFVVRAAAADSVDAIALEVNSSGAAAVKEVDLR